MKSVLFIVIVLISGALAGTIHGVVNFAIVEPYLDQAIGIENQSLFASGEKRILHNFGQNMKVIGFGKKAVRF